MTGPQYGTGIPWPSNLPYQPKPKPPMRYFGAVLLMIGGVLGFLGGPLQWVSVLGGGVNGFSLYDDLLSLGEDPSYLGMAPWVVAFCGVVMLVCGGVFIARKDNPIPIIVVASVVVAVAVLSAFLTLVSPGTASDIAQFGIGLWCFLVSGVIGAVGVIGSATRAY